MKYHHFTTSELQPTGWLKRQLELQANGLAGNLDKVWPDVRDSAWIGGNREGWERVPYWLDGFIPMAYLLKDEDKIARAKKYIDAILERQQASGWICPCSEAQIPTYDTWAIELISKVLLVYYDCSHDERIPDVLYRMMRNFYGLLISNTIRMFDWSRYRWFEGFIALNFLWERYHEEWIKSLAKIMKDQGYDYFSDEARKVTVRPLNKWTHQTHVVNMAMMLKYEAVSYELLGTEYRDEAETLYSELMLYNGTPAGIFTGDECLSGLSPIQGTELCAVVELMYSFECLYDATGDAKWLERLETVAFNALPAAISDDMWAHQYDQMSNQISCEAFPGKSLFRTNNSEAHLFGLEPHFGCCTANFGQGWPKLALSAFLQEGDSILSSMFLPSVLDADGIHIELKTDYPFLNTASYHIETEKTIQLKVRIPSFAKNVTINGTKMSNTGLYTQKIQAHEAVDVNVAFETETVFIARPYNLYSVKCGSLLFSLPIRHEKKMLEYERDSVERKYPYCDWEYIGKSEWRYGFAGDILTVRRNAPTGVPFSSELPAVTISAKMKRVDWEYEDGYDTVCAKRPVSNEGIGEVETVQLYPYGCAKLRMTEMPVTGE